MADEKPAPKVQFNSNYVKDVSFENIGLQNNYIAQSQPKFDMNLNITNKEISENVFEVSIHIKVKATEGEQTIFLLDLDHAGRFTLSNISAEQRVPFLYIECPRLLFPYTRRIVSQLTLDGGLLPLNLDQVDFVQLFQNSVERARQQQAENAPAETN